MSQATAVLVGAVFGAAVGGLLGGLWLSPSDADLRAAALELIPDASANVEVGENTGAPVIVGEYFVHVTFESGDPMETVHRGMLAAGNDHGWRIDAETHEAGGIVARLSKDSMAAQTTAYTRIPSGAVQVRTDRTSLALRVSALVAAAATLGGGIGFVLNRHIKPPTIA